MSTFAPARPLPLAPTFGSRVASAVARVRWLRFLTANAYTRFAADVEHLRFSRIERHRSYQLVPCFCRTCRQFDGRREAA